MNQELQQQLMEFVYGLLDEDEANALCERITSDPQVARAYAKIKLQCDLVARAARYDAPTVAWSRPDGNAPANGDIRAASKVGGGQTSRRLANWCIGVAASGLICLVGSAYWMSAVSSPHDSQPLAFSVAPATPVEVVVTGPSRLNAEVNSQFTVQVANHAGTPVSTTLKYQVYDVNGALSWQDSASTDESGVARFDVNPTVARDASRLEITTADDSPEPIRRELEPSPERFVTYLRMDRPLYQPGERLWYRSVTLSRFALRSDREVTTSFEIVNSGDEQIEGSAITVETEHGVGSGMFDLPNDLPDGAYTLVARSPNDLFRDEWRDFQVRRYAAPQLLKKLELAKDSYSLGDQVDVDFSVKRVAGEPLAESRLQIQAAVDGVPLAAPEAKTDANGNSRFSLSLPELIVRGEANVSVTVQAGDDPAETITKEIPINLGKVNVDFYPEGGDLAAGLPSRVYFYGRDPLGKPAHIEGRIVDSGDHEICEVVTGHEGRGVFSLTPVADEQYRLILDKPVGVTKEAPLPVASADRFATIETGPGVFTANGPIAFTLYQHTPPKPLIVAAYCRGAMVAQQTVDPDAYGIEQADAPVCRGELSLPDQAQGVIRLTVFDATPSPPEPIAERLVYRRVGQKLDIRVKPDAETFAPGQDVEIVLMIRDENDAPVSAALGISIVDDAVLNLADDKSMRMPTYFHLLTEIDSSEQLEDANFYLSDQPESAAALDSLLGTQGWRRFTELPATQLAQAESAGAAGGFGGGGYGFMFRDERLGSRFRAAAWAEETAVPLSTAATMDIRENGLRQSTPLARAAPSSRTSLALPIIIASLVLVTLVGVTSLRSAQSNRPLRVFAGVVAVASLAVGVLNLPAKAIRVDLASDNAASPASREVAMYSEEPMAAGAAEEADPVPVPSDASSPDGFMFESDESQKWFKTPPADAPAEAESSGRLGGDAAPGGAARFAVPRERLRRADDAGAVEKAADLLPNKDKKEAMPPPAPEPSAAAARPISPLPADDAFSKKGMVADDQSRSLAAKNPLRALTREYAQWSFEAQSSIPPADQSSATIFWLPLFVADETGKATVVFKLPQRPSSFRAIVEAHGADRLGSGELLIESREP